MVVGDLSASASERVIERDAKRRHQRPRLAGASSDIGVLTTDLGLDRVELAKAVERAVVSAGVCCLWRLNSSHRKCVQQATSKT